MKIAYCIPATSNSGGMERVLARKANYLAAAGHQITIITTDQRGAKPFFDLDPSIAQYDLDINYDANNGQGLWSKLSGYPKRKRLHRQRLEQLLLELRVDIVISMFGDDASFLPQIQDGSRKVLEYHFAKYKRLQYGRRGLWRLVDQLRTKWDERIVQPFDRFVVLTEEDAAAWGALPHLEVIPNPLPFISEQSSDCRSKQVLALGRYDAQKHFDLLLDLWAQVSPDYPDWQLVIAGDGPLRPTLTAQLERLGLSRSVTLQRPTQQVEALYLSSSVYVMTSRYEGLPMVLIEAQHMGLPIVSFACPCGPRDVIAPGVDGYLLELGDEAGFVARLRQLMDSEQERQRLGAAARTASERYELKRIMDAWEALFTSLISQSK